LKADEWDFWREKANKQATSEKKRRRVIAPIPGGRREQVTPGVRGRKRKVIEVKKKETFGRGRGGSKTDATR